MRKKALVVIPTYNEREGIKSILPEIFKVASSIDSWDLEVLIVDDNSPDGTAEEVRSLQKHYHNKLHLIEGKKEGLGKAYVRGFGYAIENLGPDVMFEMDGDGQHPPSLIPSFLKKIDEGYDFVIGSRYIAGGSIPNHWSWNRKFYSVIGNLVAQLGFMNFKAHDWTSGFRCIKSSYLKDVLYQMKNYNGYVFQIALLDKAFKHSLKIGEVPLNFTDRLDGESKFSSIQFITDALRYILTQSSFVRFAVVGGLGFIVDFGFAAVFIHYFDMFKPTANALSAEAAVIFNFFMNNTWSFKHKKIKGSYIYQLLKFNLVASGSIVIQWLGMKLALDTFGDHILVIPYAPFDIHTWMVYKILIIAFLVIPYSYIMYNKVIWKSPASVE